MELPVARFPDIAFPMTTVTVMQPGASPSQLETEVTRRVEDSGATIPDIKRAISTVTEGVSTKRIEFEKNGDATGGERVCRTVWVPWVAVPLKKKNYQKVNKTR